MRRYNIVLTPKSANCSIFEEFAQKHFGKVTSGYLLGNESVPHITLCQFECEEEKFPAIAAETAKVNFSKSYSPVLQGLSLIKLDGQFAGQHAAEVSVARTEELMSLQRSVVDVVQSLGINPLNALGDQYRPHLTLAFFYPEQAKDCSIPIVLPSEIFESREFSVSIGLTDQNWQFNKIFLTLSDDEFTIANILRKYFGYGEEQVAKFGVIREKLDLTLDDFIQGKVYAGGSYSTEEKRVILEDMQKIVAEQFLDVIRSARPLYVATAGAPGCGKTYFIEQQHGVNPSDAVYIEPDRIGLPGLTKYKQDLEISSSEAAYTKWRNASNFIANFMLVTAITEQVNIVHGTTATNTRVPAIYSGLRELGYNISVHLLFADSVSRSRALMHREMQQGTHVTQTDARGKVKPVFDRMVDAYFKYADMVYMYFQYGEYWLDNGELMHFASFDRTRGVVSIMADRLVCIEHLKVQAQEELSEDQLLPILRMIDSWVIPGINFGMTSQYEEQCQQIGALASGDEDAVGSGNVLSTCKPGAP